MFIYVSGPYSPANSETDPDARKKSIAENIEKANKVALEIVKKGHVPFVPHTMMAGWEDVHGLPREASPAATRCDDGQVPVESYAIRSLVHADVRRVIGCLPVIAFRDNRCQSGAPFLKRSS